MQGLGEIPAFCLLPNLVSATSNFEMTLTPLEIWQKSGRIPSMLNA